MEKGGAQVSTMDAGTITRAQVLEIATLKMKDLNALEVEAAAKMIEGSARSMGIKVVD